MSDRVTVCKPTEELDRLRMWTDDAAAEITRLCADLAAAQEREQRMREALDVTLSRFQSFKFNSLGDHYDPGTDADFADARAALGEPQ